jgi:hypothetical protein
MDKPDTQGGIWDGDGPKSAEPSPTVTCQVESNPSLCSFPFCDCAALTGNPREDFPTVMACASARLVDDAIIEALATEPDGASPVVVSGGIAAQLAAAALRLERRKPKRDRAAYMRGYRAQKKAARKK